MLSGVNAQYLCNVGHDRVAGAGRHHEARPLGVAGPAGRPSPARGRDVADEAVRHLGGGSTGKGIESEG